MMRSSVWESWRCRSECWDMGSYEGGAGEVGTECLWESAIQRDPADWWRVNFAKRQCSTTGASLKLESQAN